MEQIYIVMIIALIILAITDLMVGVANDAVNFLNSAIGSKALPLKTILIVASIGVALGAIFSGGMMEVARKGIFNPEMFYFNDIMIIFMAVMITDILLLDFFNTLGLPTSTTVSIVFELLGSAVILAAIKTYKANDSLQGLGTYINTEKASQIIIGIVLSVIIAFTIGAIVQYVARLFLTFNYQNKAKWVGAIFGGVALSSILYFILIKGLKGTQLYEIMKPTLANQLPLVLFFNFIFWTFISFLIVCMLKRDIYKIVILAGTFALALAFAGNDLVNFIGVPIAAYQSYEFWSASGIEATAFSMEVLQQKVPAPMIFLAVAGGIMILTLWYSKKSMTVLETEQNLARQSEGSEKYRSNIVSRLIVRSFSAAGVGLEKLIPVTIQKRIDARFTPVKFKGKRSEEPMFDTVRAAINLVVAAIIISIATSWKLPLSTTYVTFMVAMGTSFADRAWGRESAVYRIAGVLAVVGGWFMTALIAFTVAGIIACALYFGEAIAFFAIIIVVAILFYRSNQKHKENVKEKEEIKELNKEDIVSIDQVINESSDRVAKLINRTKTVYSDVIIGLATQDLTRLKKNRKTTRKINKQVDELKSNVYYFIKNLNEPSVESSRFYVLVLGYIQDVIQSMSFITDNSHYHIDNNHKSLKYNQIKDLKQVDELLKVLFKEVRDSIKNKNYSNITLINRHNEELSMFIKELMERQITRIRTTENSPKNSKLYFEILLETNDLIEEAMNLLVLFRDFDSQIKQKTENKNHLR